jgi:hypothetical protein
MGLKEAHQNKLEAAVLRPEKWIFFYTSTENQSI